MGDSPINNSRLGEMTTSTCHTGSNKQNSYLKINMTFTNLQ